MKSARSARRCLPFVILALLVCLLIGAPSAAAHSAADATVITKMTNGGDAYFLKGFLMGVNPVRGVMYCDDSVVKGANFVNQLWVLPKHVKTKCLGGVWASEGVIPHTHKYGEMDFFTSGGAPGTEEGIKEDRNLGGQVVVTLNGERHVITTTSYVWIPAGVKHTIVYTNMTKPILQVRYLAGPRYTRSWAMPVRDTDPADNYGHLIYSEMSDWGGGPPQGISANYIGPEFDTRSPSIVDAGIYYSDSSAILPVPAGTRPDRYPPDIVCGWRGPHAHMAGGEYFLNIGLNANKPSDLGGKMRYSVNQKVYYFDKTAYVYVPAGTWHCPIDFIELKSPAQFMPIGAAPIPDWDYVPMPKPWPVTPWGETIPYVPPVPAP